MDQLLLEMFAAMVVVVVVIKIGLDSQPNRPDTVTERRCCGVMVLVLALILAWGVEAMVVFGEGKPGQVLIKHALVALLELAVLVRESQKLIATSCL